MPDLPRIPARLSQIDDLVRGDHFHLTPADDCYFLWEWNVADWRIAVRREVLRSGEHF